MEGRLFACRVMRMFRLVIVCMSRGSYVPCLGLFLRCFTVLVISALEFLFYDRGRIDGCDGALV